MKKGILTLSALFAALFIGASNTNALVQVPSNQDLCTQIAPTQSSAYNMQCNMQLQVTADASVDPRVTIATGDEFVIYFSLVSGRDTFNITDNKIELTAATGWLIDGESSKTITIKEDGTVSVTVKYTGDTYLGPETYTFATVKYQKDDTTAENCGFAYGTPIPSLTCKIVTENNVSYYYGDGGQYLGTGEEESAVAEYYKQCFACTTPDQSPDGKYRDKDGKETDEAGYKKDCTNICKIENDKYYCKEGTECTKEEYENECQSNPKSGSFIPYAGIIAGIVLIGVSTIMVRKQSKLRKL